MATTATTYTIDTNDTNDANTTTGIITPESKPACSDIPDWDAGYGGCHTYAMGGKNAGWCNFDFDRKSSTYAKDACLECGLCTITTTTTTPPAPACSDIPDWDAGYGGCHTYAMGGKNAGWCNSDFDWKSSTYAKDVCLECGLCTITTTTTPPPPCIPDWDAGYGGCHTYGMGGKNAGWCNYHFDWKSYTYAKDACLECGLCTMVTTPIDTNATQGPGYILL